MLTKTDFLHYLEAPMHLWARKHSQSEQEEPSAHLKLLIAQGQQVERLAQNFLLQRIGAATPQAEIRFQVEVSDEPYYARLDAAVTHPESGLTDLYEIKSGSSVSKEHKLDAAFQRLVAETKYAVGAVYLVYLNKEYVFQGTVNLDELFLVEDLSADTEESRPALLAGREAAWQIAQAETSAGIAQCYKPKECPCPALCHPGLPEHSIYELPRIRADKIDVLLQSGIRAILDLPIDYPLSPKQQAHADVVRAGKPSVNLPAIREILASLTYPLFFLDYESYNPAVPWYPGYKTYQHVVFQYSLHIVASPDAEPVHAEYLSLTDQDPVPDLLADLIPRLGDSGSVIVWYRPFEASRNREMGVLCPEFSAQLENVNSRIFDLMEVVSQGSYVHPDFCGSASIKNVLPVLVPDLRYDSLSISNGTDAMGGWVGLIRGELEPDDFGITRQALLDYCKLDTKAMLEIWRFLVRLVQDG